jgi:hypothetical protein
MGVFGNQIKAAGSMARWWGDDAAAFAPHIDTGRNVAEAVSYDTSRVAKEDVFPISPVLNRQVSGRGPCSASRMASDLSPPWRRVAIDDENPAGPAGRDTEIPKLIVKPGLGHVLVSRGVPEPDRHQGRDRVLAYVSAR